MSVQLPRWAQDWLQQYNMYSQRSGQLRSRPPSRKTYDLGVQTMVLASCAYNTTHTTVLWYLAEQIYEIQTCM